MYEDFLELTEKDEQLTLDIEYQDTDADLDNKVQRSQERFQTWKRTPIKARCEFITNFGSLLLQNQNEYAQLITKEMGKPIRQARKEIEKCQKLCAYYAEHAQELLENQYINTENSSNIISFKPIGPVLGIMPWNYPFWQSIRFAVPALLAGNTVLLKLAENTHNCSIAINECFKSSGIIDGVFDSIFANHHQTTKLIEHPAIQGISFTGSRIGAAKIGQQAGQKLKKTVFELGGSDPYIVLDDANLEQAIQSCINARFENSGQSCISAKRFIIEKGIYDKFTDRFIAICKDKSIGDPFDENTDIGPLAKKQAVQKIHTQVQETIKAGGLEVYSSKINSDLESVGFFYPIKVIEQALTNSPLLQEEVFGPVAVICKAQDQFDAIKLANNTNFGLGAAVFSDDQHKALAVAKEIDAGMCAINGQLKSHWKLPFGGVKESGYGRELGESGIKSFTNERVLEITQL